MMRLYDLEPSGNCYKIRLFLSLLGKEYERITVNLPAGEHKQRRFLTLNPFGEIPVLEDGDVLLRDSQAILIYLAKRYGGDAWLPEEPESAARVAQWLSTSSNEIANGASAARAHDKFGYKLDVNVARQLAERLFSLLDDHLRTRDWLELDRPTIADIACYPYLGLAPEGGVNLDPYPAVRRWMDRIKALPRYVSMPGIY